MLRNFVAKALGVDNSHPNANVAMEIAKLKMAIQYGNHAQNLQFVLGKHLEAQIKRQINQSFNLKERDFVNNVEDITQIISDCVYSHFPNQLVDNQRQTAQVIPNNQNLNIGFGVDLKNKFMDYAYQNQLGRESVSSNTH